MSFTDRKPFVATEEQTKLKWGGGFFCKLCGMKFKAGDTVRFIYGEGKVINFLVCSACDKGDADTRNAAIESHALAVRLAKQWNIYGPDWQRDSR